MLNLTKPLFMDKCNLEITGYYNLTSGDYFIRPKITWKPADAFSFIAGGTYLDGPDKSVFSYSRPVLAGIFLEMKVSF